MAAVDWKPTQNMSEDWRFYDDVINEFLKNDLWIEFHYKFEKLLSSLDITPYASDYYFSFIKL